MPLWKVTMDTIELASKPSVKGDYKWFSGLLGYFEGRSNTWKHRKSRTFALGPWSGSFQRGWMLILSRDPNG